MSGKLSRKERAQLQKAKQPVDASIPQPKKKPVNVTRSNSLVRNLNYVLIALAAVIYFNTLFNEYALDDYSLILENTQTQQGTSAFFKIFGSSYREGYMSGDNTLYRPLSKAMFAVEWSISPQGPGLNHFVNVLLFTLSVVLLFRMLRLYMKGQLLIPFITAAIFAAHPIHTEVVANIKGRDDILCFLLFVVTALYVHRYTVSGLTKHLAYAGISFFFCFLSKESAITFVAVIPLLLYFFTDADRKTYINTGGMLLGVTALFLLIRYAVLSGGGISPVPVVDNYIAGIDSFITQRTTAIAIAGIYLMKLFVPYSLVCDASVAQIPVYGPGDWQFLVPFVIFLGAFVFAVMKFKTKHPVAFGILYFFVTFSMVSNIPFILGTNYGERLLYAPSLGICFILAFAISKLFRSEEGITSSSESFFPSNRNALMVTSVLVLIYSVLTFNRNPEWRDNYTLYATDLQKSPNSCKLHFYFANHITQKENLALYPEGSVERTKIIDTAIVEFKQAIALYPAYTDPMQKLAEMLFEKKQYDSAEYYYRKAIHLFPSNAVYRNNFGRMLFTQGRMIEAKYQFEMAVKFNPNYSTAYNNLAGVYGTMASKFVTRAQNDPAHAEEHAAKARELFTQSVNMSLRAIATDPNNLDAYNTTAMTYQFMGDQVNAQKYSQMAQQLKLGKK